MTECVHTWMGLSCCPVKVRRTKLVTIQTGRGKIFCSGRLVARKRWGCSPVTHLKHTQYCLTKGAETKTHTWALLFASGSADNSTQHEQQYHLKGFKTFDRELLPGGNEALEKLSGPVKKWHTILCLSLILAHISRHLRPCYSLFEPKDMTRGRYGSKLCSKLC